MKAIAEELVLEQRTDEWYLARLGLATASNFKDILAKTKAGTESAARRNYRAQLVLERLTGRTPDRFKSAAMEWGTETEDLARVQYLMLTDNKVEEAGLFRHPKLMAGASPDGRVTSGKEEGGLEIKCYNTANHILALRANQMPKEHIPQVQGQMWLGGWRWVDFVSFDPDMPENAQVFITRVMRDEEYIKMLTAEVTTFLAEVDEEVAFVQSYKRQEEKNGK